MSGDAPTTSDAAPFPATAWERIQVVQDPGHPDHVAMANWFITAYWKPVFHFIRAKGHRLQEAEDLTQEFFLRFVERDWIRPADPGRGRFRNFLLRIVGRFLADRGPKRAPRQQHFERQFVSVGSLLGEEERSFEPPADVTPEALFMKEWARALLQTVQDRLRELYTGEGRRVWYGLFAAVHGRAPSEKRPRREALAEAFGLTPDQVRYGLEQAEKRFRRLLRAEVRAQVASEEEIDEEISELLALLQGR